MTLCYEFQIRRRGFKRFAAIIKLMTATCEAHHADVLA